MFRVAVTDDRLGIYDIEERILNAVGAELTIYDLKPDQSPSPELCDYDALIVNLYPMNREAIAGLSRCRIIQRYGVGYDNVDVSAATDHGIWVANVPDYSVEDVSDHALGLLYNCVRNIAFTDRNIRAGEWNIAGRQKGYRMRGKVLGIVGYGAIARRLHAKTAGFGLERVLIYDPYVDAGTVEAAGAEKTELDRLFAESDYISLHLPLTDETRGMIGREAFAAMKTTAILINTCRGAVVDEQALICALEQREIGGAGLDVFEAEPLPANSPLRRLENVVLTDHTSWYSEESVEELRRKVAENVAQVLTTGRPKYHVNHIENEYVSD